MPPTLTPDQQAKLDQFETDAQAASDAATATTQADADLLTAQAAADHDKQVALDTNVKALASGQAFIDAMLGRTPATPPTP